MTPGKPQRARNARCSPFRSGYGHYRYDLAWTPCRYEFVQGADGYPYKRRLYIFGMCVSEKGPCDRREPHYASFRIGRALYRYDLWHTPYRRETVRVGRWMGSAVYMFGIAVSLTRIRPM